ncbi:hypothetical protein [Pararhizobium qamdonense]|uniref:hypothetical protein n=1 Tax=Pararhizobium qamdonense TaxID=3031126 RepID=UPI0023E22334|nr:hypothetical protein [Pararhizobium qamdonense]
MVFTLFAYELPSGDSASMIFADTVEQCHHSALELRRELRELDFEAVPVMGIFKCWMRLPDEMTLKQLLNGEIDLLTACLVEKKLIALVADS